MHHHDHSHHHGHSTTKNIKIAFFINLLFSIIELIGGLWTNSIAILSDALHDFGDSLSLGVSWYFQNVSHKERDQNFSYGYARFSVAGAVINSIVLVVGSIIILTESIPRLFDPQNPNGEGMIYLAIGGIVFNGLAAWKLHEGKSLNERAVYLHLLEDILGWVATLIAAILIQFWNIPIVDPILAMGIAGFILFNVYKNLKQAATIILQGIPEGINIEKIQNLLKAMPGVKDVHDCHVWTLDGQFHVLSVHLVVGDNEDMESLANIKAKAKHDLLHEKIDHATIEFETEAEECEPC
ncbi:cation diffusion facilitator family transporter [Marinoscillum sp. MHG1-6]|uniref:cation diffusion facilitator family transporter n=1 Tax=Marinoscillum sp. MHG1-6 TaxID=2959627 RepID=UPI0021572848|nr:cation diffusion facilitator family transporter [Marinoscillum sp. MHG1-6]